MYPLQFDRHLSGRWVHSSGWVSSWLWPQQCGLLTYNCSWERWWWDLDQHGPLLGSLLQGLVWPMRKRVLHSSGARWCEKKVSISVVCLPCSLLPQLTFSTLWSCSTSSHLWSPNSNLLKPKAWSWVILSTALQCLSAYSSKLCISWIPPDYNIAWDDTNRLFQLLQDVFSCWQEDGQGVNYLCCKFVKLNGRVSMQVSQL